MATINSRPIPQPQLVFVTASFSQSPLGLTQMARISNAHAIFTEIGMTWEAPPNGIALKPCTSASQQDDTN